MINISDIKEARANVNGLLITLDRRYSDPPLPPVAPPYSNIFPPEPPADWPELDEFCGDLARAQRRLKHVQRKMAKLKRYLAELADSAYDLSADPAADSALAQALQQTGDYLAWLSLEFESSSRQPALAPEA